ncbi:toxin MazF [Staphylococcus epidermidis]|nr:toxin MazF [Staphylococcus epidermidis]MCG1992518.1 toxin MazF [Staphylococcus epidermidis]MCG1997012.1 toxin MazF [Staphylococcus epidermidis]MCG2352987.1 toxin MazF [Staphylococcus epidermidis]MCG2381925.1 toxin MazF [Staphylococcus epidermidis]
MSHKIEKRINNLKHSDNPKFKNLDSDIHYLIKRFEGEKNHKGYFPKFKQGEIIFVDFGINVNREFSSSHFAIVMNKSDSHTEDILNVIPLSSKENKRYLKIDLDLKWEYIRESLIQLTKIENQLSNYSNTLEDFTSNFNEDNDMFDSFIDKLRFLHEMEHYVNTVNVETNNIKSAIDKTQRLKGNSYACINAFQPISKFRIRKLFPKNVKNPVVEIDIIISLINEINNNILQIRNIR